MKNPIKNNLAKNKKALSDIINIKSHLKNKNKEESLLSAGIIFLIAAVAVSVLNYLYHLFMGRMLGPSDYGILGSLFALIYIATYATTAFNLSISKFSAELNTADNQQAFNSLIKKSISYISIFGAIVLVFYISLSPVIAIFMNLDSISGLLIVGLIAYFFVISAVLTGALNGMQKFIWQNSSGIISGFLKFALAVVLVYLGFGVNGALIAILIGIVAGILIMAYPLKSAFTFQPGSSGVSSKKISKYFFFVFFASLIPILLITIDQVLVKHYFSSAEAGYYVAAGMLAKIIWFGSGFLVGPLFPKVVSLYSKGKDTSKILVKAMLYSGFLIVVGCIAYFVIPTFITSMLYGSSYLAVVPFLGLFAVAMGLFSLAQILITYDLAKERFGFLWILLAGLIIELAGIYAFHSSLSEIVKIVFAANCFVLISLIFYNRKEIFSLK